MAKENDEKKPNGGAPGSGAPSPFDDSEFFTAEGVTDDDEKEAIRARARVTRYAEWRRKKEEEDADPKRKKKSGKKWFQE
jgi:hypothetical protein